MKLVVTIQIVTRNHNTPAHFGVEELGEAEGDGETEGRAKRAECTHWGKHKSVV